jgi:predicted nucleotidyltransferase
MAADLTSVDLPESVKNFTRSIIESGLAQKIVLFGSRARGDHRENSDTDLAIDWAPHKSVQVQKLLQKLNDEPITLHKIDILNLNEASSQYLTEISKEGVVLWQKKA